MWHLKLHYLPELGANIMVKHNIPSRPPLSPRTSATYRPQRPASNRILDWGNWGGAAPTTPGGVLAAQPNVEFLRKRSARLSPLMEAPLDDEPFTEDDRAALAEARAAQVRGDVVRDEHFDRALRD